MLNKKAVIDIGTNTFHLLIATVDEDKNINVIYKNTIAVKLGEGGVNKGFITPEAYQRGIDALLSFRAALDEHNVDNVKATATAAVRGASNGQLFINEALSKTNILIEIIDGLKEAEYIYAGANGAGVLNDETALIMDIGGGSVEFIICNQHEIFWKKSYLLGAARLLADYYKDENAIDDATIAEMEKAFALTLTDLQIEVEKLQPSKLIGTAGSFDSYANILSIRKNQNFNANTVKCFKLQLTEFESLLEEIITSTHQQRLEIDGLISLRTDMILMASILTRYVLKTSGIKETITCTYSLKEGLLLNE
ncbi:MAG TPA: exopolyphosphatase [Pelobium sp.]|nr:exopolyphosphatase [Pelobium sp.]